MFEENFPPVMCAFNYTELAAGSRVRVVLSKHVGKIQTTNQLSSLELPSFDARLRALAILQKNPKGLVVTEIYNLLEQDESKG